MGERAKAVLCRAFLLAALFSACGLFAAPATVAFAPEALGSVVVVLPEWPDAKERQARRLEPEGSGVAIRAGGYLVTNHHVLGRAITVDVRLADGRVVPAEIVARDAATDLAVLKIAEDLPLLRNGPEPALGAPVCAVGNPFGFGLSVSCGVVSALHRTGTGFNPIEDFVQTDAAANPGTSGGALVDAAGRLVGILTSTITTAAADAQLGVNFAISLPLVMRVTADLIEHGKVRRAKLGVRLRDFDKSERHLMPGAPVTNVFPDGAGAAELKAGDVITAVGARPVRKAADVTSAVSLFRPGERVALTVRRNGKTQIVTVELTP